jgi:hypothetical protein
MFQQTTAPSRRVNSRIAVRQEIWVCWYCNGRDDISRVRDVSLGGLFLETPSLRTIGAATKVDFLVSEGQIRVDAVVKHRLPGRGLGLKFTALTEQDRRNFASLLRRLRA